MVAEHGEELLIGVIYGQVKEIMKEWWSLH